MHPYSDQGGNGYCFECGLTEAHDEAEHVPSDAYLNHAEHDAAIEAAEEAYRPYSWVLTRDTWNTI